MGRRSRNKGKRGENEAAKALGALLGLPVRRTVQYSGRRSGEADLAGLEGLSIEVKRCERLLLYDALEQARETAERDGRDVKGLVLHRRNRHKWVACMYLEDLPHVAEIIARLHREANTAAPSS